jgi:hypothetical protein
VPVVVEVVVGVVFVEQEANIRDITSRLLKNNHRYFFPIFLSFLLWLTINNVAKWYTHYI